MLKTDGRARAKSTMRHEAAERPRSAARVSFFFPSGSARLAAASSTAGSLAAKCATSSNIDINALTTCVRGAEAAALQQRFHDLTPADHKYTPWVTLNGVQMVTNKVPTLSHHICSLWKAAGGKKPAGCPLI